VYPLFTVFAALIVLKEKLNRVQIAGVGLALVAIYLLSSG
jgi:EamA domain-containing membrane protein RarD